ncbi:cell wall biogenesis protein Mhp1 [Paecilomyces variotii No. 5]|uniref:Cell wall biogenesis protein Mhp1 n=1 Tax=Byssochlamys spectabilis (strain No. 5 / NBRC 109023) TaxID=1356009 RepID=V5G3G8_BYSSN|nr:cell wall biogenesis protein Mhp1 [Paecilomyces variotii No. 5]
MESVQTVDVSWLHHSQKDTLSRSKSTSSAVSDKSGSSVDTTETQPAANPLLSNTNHHTSSTAKSSPDPTTHTAAKSPDDLKTRSVNETTGENKGSIQAPGSQNAAPKSAGSTPPRQTPSRRPSWISNLSSKFSSSASTSPAQNNQKENSTPPKPIPSSSRLDLPNPFGAAYSPKDKDEKNGDGSSNPFLSSSPRSGFLHNALRKLSSSSTNGSGKMATNGVICQRRVMNVNQNRDRCRVPDLNQAKLKRVAFCVDVEIAGISRRESDDEKADSGSKKTDVRSKEKGEGEALKHPQAALPEKDNKTAATDSRKELVQEKTQSDSKTDVQAKEPTRKQEKKKRSEEERKERKERKRRLAEANGSIPMQLTWGEDDDDASSAPTSSSARSRTQSHPTTDPVRIYRRCCQLRETPVLKKLVEQISSPSSTLAESPGTVAVLDLTNFPMTLEDIITFSDWLAVVPVRKLILENCALTDEGVRSILAGLLATKTAEQARYYRRKSRKSKLQGSLEEESFGVVEKLSLKNNTKIGPEGWRHICLFLHLSKSLKAIDLSGIPFPRPPVTANGPGSVNRTEHPGADIGAVFSSALEKRFGGSHLEELLLSECRPTTDDVGKICDAAIAFGLRRFGFANNGLDREGLQHVIRYLQSGKCEGLDLGGNPLEDHLDLLPSALDTRHPLYALSLADCSLTPPTLAPLLQTFTRLPNFRFVDLSHNRGLFSSQPNALAMLRRYLPKMPLLKRIHLADVDLSPDHAIALAEVLPECPSLCHLNIMENPRIRKLSAATDPASQEEACAVYASLMAAVRVSRTIIAVDIEVPTTESNEVVKALASQIVAYSLRNLERSSIEEDFSGTMDPRAEGDVPVPEILQHIVGHLDGEEPGEEDDETAPDEDYVIGGTGVVKALGVCLGNADHHHSDSLDFSAPPSGTTTPRQRKSRSRPPKRPRDMSKNLLVSARNIRLRIQSALVREDRAGNDTNYRRLQFLDFTLQKMIQRFEDEYPETRVAAPPAPAISNEDSSSQHSDEINDQGIAGRSPPSGANFDDETAIDDEDTENYVIGISRSSSNTSLHSRALTSEEGHIHRLGQSLRRNFLKDYPAATLSTSPLDESHMASLREKLELLRGEQIRSRVESVGPDKALEELGCTMEELWWIQKQDAEAFQKFKESQIAAQINAGMRPGPLVDEEAVDNSAVE